ncbi:MAG: hypothetical protein EAZ40_09485 [Rhodobacterales bacterium]|nr:MAG: hypothetical protein EAZ40_09485 [Rhodobacterales bacterium]
MEDDMLRTITIGSSLQVQGVAVGSSSDGKLTVKVGDKVYTGRPVPNLTQAKAYQPVNQTA